MTKALLTLSILVAGLAAQADIISCNFTEPFVDVTYSTTTSELTVLDHGNEGKKTIIKNASFQIKGAGQFEILGKDKKVLMTLDLNFKGSDSMSEAVYPYHAEYDNMIGACESNFLKATHPEPESSIED